MGKTNVVRTPMDDELRELLSTLKEMENYVDVFVNNAKGMDMRKALMVGAYRAAAEYSSGIRIMLESRPMAKVANVLLRSLFEVYGTIEYISLRDDDYYLLKEMQVSSSAHEQSMKHLEEYFDEHSLKKLEGLEINKIRSNQTKAQKSIEGFEKEIRKIERNKGKIDYTSRIHKQFKKIDELRPPEKPEMSLYYSYLILYPLLSADVHLGTDGILSWMDFKGKTIVYNPSNGTSDSEKRVLWTAIALLKDISIRVMNELDMFDDEYDNKYQAIIDKYQK